MKLIALLLVIVATAQVDGVSYIGLCNPSWDCEKTMYTWLNKPIAVGWLEQSFGAACPCASRILFDARPKTIRVHLINSACMRNSRCEKHDALYGYNAVTATQAVYQPKSRLRKKFERTLKRVKYRVKKSRGELTCYVSPCLECDLDGNARKSLLRLVSRRVRRCIPVDNPLRDSCLSGYVCEKHGRDTTIPQPCIHDLDGTEVRSSAELKQYGRLTNGCELRFYWSHWMNCNVEGKPFVPPSQRVCNSSVYKMMKAGEIKWK